MGMDVYGLAPIAEEGKYFRRSVWGWRPLAQFILSQVPERITRNCTYWQSNDGDGLNALWSRALSAELFKLIRNGSAETYVVMRDATIAELPPVTCPICHGTGTGIAHGQNVPRGCTGCKGTGKSAHWESYYSLTLEDIQEFASFAEASGGFAIY